MCQAFGGGNLKVSELISKGIDKGIECGKKIKEYMIDDTINDMNNFLEIKKKEKDDSDGE